ncbi:MAG: glycosyltransferase [Candidatus Bathyarchaeota archaeon]|nr:glycosyltransferase [Candidatus Bathyarchaeota archaeon]
MTPNHMASIIIPCKTIDPYTKECISHCKQLNYPNFEIIVLPDSDSTPIEDVKIISTGPVSPGSKRNIGIKNSNGEICAFIDNDAYPRVDWLTQAVILLQDKSISGVGGPGVTPETDSSGQKASGYVLSSFMVGSLASRCKGKAIFESTDIPSCNFIAPKALILQAGGWNEKYWPGEDTLMCLELRKLGKLVESSEIVVYHHRRSLFKPHIRQVSRFGEHRGFFVKKYPENSIRPTYFLPSLLVAAFVVGLVLSLFVPLFAYIFLLGIATYLVCGLAASVMQVKDARMVFLVWAGIIVTHLIYGCYFVSGLAKSDLKR